MLKKTYTRLFSGSAQVQVPVNEFTEKTINVPVTLVNNSDYYNVNILPKKVKVTFTTTLNKYAEISEEYFEAQANLNMWKQYGYKVLPIKVTKLPDFCRIVKIEPQNVDFNNKK